MALDILIIDDEDDIRDLIAGILEDEGYEARQAHDADSALNEIARRRPSLVFLDIWMQGSRLDGLQLLDLFQAQHPDMPVVMISATAMSKPRSAPSSGAPMTISRSHSRSTGCS
jgi:two-component system nitrogen regulation response regulator NtrX